MNHRRMKELIHSLHRETVRNSVSWTQTEREEVYQTSFPNFSIRVFRQPTVEDNTGGDDYWLSIHNSEGLTIDQVSDINMRSDLGGRVKSYDTMKELFDEARRAAMGVHDALDEILNTLRTADIDLTLPEDE